MKYYKQIIPEKLEPKLKDIEKHPPSIPGFRMSYLLQVVYWICTKKDENGYSYLNIIYLRTYIPQGDQYLKFLLTEGIIERTSNYKPGSRSYGYKFTNQYESKYIVKAVTDTKLIERLSKVPEKWAYGFGTQNKYIKSFTFDPEVLRFAEATYSGESLKNAIVSITMVNNEEKYSLVDDAGGRFYSNLTNMPKELRQFVMVKNDYLKANVDIKNSQPYFTTLILTNPAKVAKFAKNKEFAMLLKHLHIPDNDDIKLYIKLVTKGQFYEYLMPYFEVKGLPCTRPDVKDSVMKILFDQNRESISRAKRIFRKLFPTVFEVFSIVRGSGRGERFPILLQAIEAHIVLKVILVRINKEYPEIIAFSVHDSLLVTDNPEIVEAVMVDELAKFTGYSPVVKIDFFSPNFIFHSKSTTIQREEREEEETDGGEKRKRIQQR